MDDKKEELKNELDNLELKMAGADFWSDKDKAQATIRRIQELKTEMAGKGKYDLGDAVMTIFSGAGGDDAEDFSAILLNMYLKYFSKNKFSVSLLHENKNDHGGYRNVTVEISKKGAYGILKNESGVHRLVRISPFNAKSLRHTSFSMVEVIPRFEKSSKLSDLDIPESDIRVELSRSSGPGGQNVNKRETAV
ncbi:MAG: PCRF domain-containing protein, partial [Candidatus Magasanikbacteria bacterium]|nr:PCRF domain-containing protein [Candidatus Magasanikbacteria bacterium]